MGKSHYKNGISIKKLVDAKDLLLIEKPPKNSFLSVKENDNVYGVQDSDLILRNSITNRAKEIYKGNKNNFKSV
jgi:hypothetical protein